MLILSQLYVYPIKSLGGIAVNRAAVTDRGLQYDRRWMLVDEHNNFLSQRDVAAMALFSVAIVHEGLQVTYQPSGEVCAVPFIPALHETTMVEVWSDRCRAQRVSSEVDEWFSLRLGIRCSLVYMPDATRRRVDGRYAKDKEINSFSDGYPMLIISQASLEDLNSRLEQPVDMQRFRPNLVVSGACTIRRRQLGSLPHGRCGTLWREAVRPLRDGDH